MTEWKPRKIFKVQPNDELPEEFDPYQLGKIKYFSRIIYIKSQNTFLVQIRKPHKHIWMNMTFKTRLDVALKEARVYCYDRDIALYEQETMWG